MPIDKNLIQELFPAIKNNIYLNSCSYALGNIRAEKAIHSITKEWVDGRFDFTIAESYGERTRDMFAQFIGAQKEEIAMTSFVSNASGVIASQLGEGHGKNIVVAECEFTSNFFPWLQLKNKGYELRLLNANGGRISLDSFEKSIDKNTSLVAVSAVQSSSGFKMELKSLSELAHKNNALLFVDASQALGAIPLDAKVLGIDFLVAASYKFLLGVRGLSYLYINSELIPKLSPITPGWRSAQNPMQSFYGPNMILSQTASKMDTSLAWFPVAGELASFELINEIGLSNIHQKNQMLIDYSCQAFEKNNIPFVDFPDENKSTIFIIPTEGSDEQISKRLKDFNIEASFRQGKLRIGLHFYNEPEHIDKLCEALK